MSHSATNTAFIIAIYLNNYSEIINLHKKVAVPLPTLQIHKWILRHNIMNIKSIQNRKYITYKNFFVLTSEFISIFSNPSINNIYIHINPPILQKSKAQQ